MACGSLTLACAFHYNAWIAVFVLAPFLARSLYRAEKRPIIVVGCLLLLGSVPCAWVVWNWVHTGKPLAFFWNHSDYSAQLWSQWGWHASPWTAVVALCSSLTVYSPLVAVLAFSSMGTFVKGRTADQRPFVQSALLVGFLTGLFFLYSTDGRPAAFEPRYVLLPSVLMISIASGSLVTLWRGGDRDVRAFVSFLSIGTVVLNLSLFHETIDRVKQIDHYDYTREARKVAAYMHNLRSKNAPRLVL